MASRFCVEADYRGSFVFFGLAFGGASLADKIFYHPKVKPKVAAYAQSLQLSLLDQPIHCAWVDPQIVRDLAKRH